MRPQSGSIYAALSHICCPAEPLLSVSICCISPSAVSLVHAVLASPPALHKNTQSDLYCSIHVNTGLKVKVHSRSLTLLSRDIWEAPHGVAMELDWSEVIKTDTACLWGCMIRVCGLDLRIYPIQDLVTKGGTVKSVASGGVSAPGPRNLLLNSITIAAAWGTKGCGMSNQPRTLPQRLTHNQDSLSLTTDRKYNVQDLSKTGQVSLWGLIRNTSATLFKLKWLLFLIIKKIKLK